MPVRLEAAVQKPLKTGMGAPQVRRRGDDHGVRFHDRAEHSRKIVLVGAIPGQAPVACLAGTDVLLDEAHHDEFRRPRHRGSDLLHHQLAVPHFSGGTYDPEQIFHLRH
jgi:hypothetical protein